MAVDGVVLSDRALGRATLARQLLLERSSTVTPLQAVHHLVGMQAQIPQNPYLGLWSRLEGFDPAELARLLVDREVVRIAVMRSTIHLVTADDCLFLRPLVQPVLDGELARHPDHGPALRGVDLEPVLELARPLLAARPRTGPQLRAAMAERFPDVDAAALAYACRNLLAFVQVPPRGVWGKTGPVTSTTAESWLGRPVQANPSIDGAVLRYLAAFGPATVADVAAWSRLTGFREVLDRLRPRLRTFADERGRELFDLPDAPRPDPDTPAPVRYLPEYDNVLLSHADRRRIVPEAHRAALVATRPPVLGSVLSDGMLCGTWSIGRDDTLVVQVVPGTDPGPIEAEGRRLLAFLRPAAPTSSAGVLVRSLP